MDAKAQNLQPVQVQSDAASRIAYSVRQALSFLQDAGRDLPQDVVDDGPDAVAKTWLLLTDGYASDPKQILSSSFKTKCDVTFTCCCPFVSLSRWTLQRFTGNIAISYAPDGCMVDSFVMQKLVDCVSHRFQLQSDIIYDIADAIERHLKPKGLGIVAVAMQDSVTIASIKPVTLSVLRGSFKGNDSVKAELRALATAR